MSVLPAYTDGDYQRRNPGWHVEHSPWKAGKIIEMLGRHGLRPESICEVGCGAGEILRQLKDRLNEPCRFVGYEVSPQAHELCLTRATEGLEFRLADAADDRDHYDLMLIMDVIEHLDDYFSFLRKLRTKADRLIAHIPLDMCVNHLIRARPLADLRKAVGHIHYFWPEGAIAAVEDCGYRVIDQFYTAWSLEIPQRGWRRRLMRMPRRVGFSLCPHLTVRTLGGFSLLLLAEPAHPDDIKP